MSLVPAPSCRAGLLVGVVSDTHGVWDPALRGVFAGAHQLVHAGDVGNHGGHAAVLGALQRIAPVTAVRGNVDDDAAAMKDLPITALLHLADWSVLLVHILESPEAAAAMEQHQPDVVITGHSHRWSEATVETAAGRRQLRLNPGSAGPARFKLGRSVALLALPERGEEGCLPAGCPPWLPKRLPDDAKPPHIRALAAGSGAWPTVRRIELASKAPPRLPEARGGAARGMRRKQVVG